MIILKIKYHIKSIFLQLFYKMIYGERFKYGKKFSFRDGFHLMIEKSGKVEIGDNVFFNNECSINAHTGIRIENNCVFGENVKIYDHNHRYNDSDIPIHRQGFKASEIVIEENCWIASNVVILEGVTIGKNCVIGASNVIFQSIPANSVVVNKINQVVR